ncbi:MAG: anthranilate synthase component I family protein [Nitrospinota bacterium]
MDILPDKKKFIQLAASSQRIPVFGEERIPDLDPFLLFQELYKDSEKSFLLESGKGPVETAQFSIFGNSSSRLLKIFKSKALLYEKGSQETEYIQKDEAFKLLNFDNTLESVDYLPHFWGGWVGFVSYEAASLFEDIQLKLSSSKPVISFMEVERLFIYDHKSQKLKFILSGQDKTKESDYDDFLWEIKRVWKDVQRALMKIQLGNSCSEEKDGEFFPTTLKPLLNKDDYIDKVEKIKSYIAEGDIYQANLCQKFEASFNQEPLQLYKRLRKVNPSPFSGFLKFDDLVLVSSSPERLIKLAGSKIESRPIAGTRPRSQIEEQDKAYMEELLVNHKERAEHLMLVDLERNDLGRICKTGTVEVTDFMLLEKYSHVSHIVSNISGSLLPELGIFEILKAVFPGGTITGCPKIRCMEIINELEPVERGPYSGSFGYIGFAPYMDLNIIIRSIVIQNEKASFHVGAGIVADSIPEKEYQETLDKSAAMVEALS